MQVTQHILLCWQLHHDYPTIGVILGNRIKKILGPANFQNFEENSKTLMVKLQDSRNLMRKFFTSPDTMFCIRALSKI